MGLRTTGMLGFDGGEVLPMLDTPLLIPDFSYGFVEDLHMVLDHLVTAYFTRQLQAPAPRPDARRPALAEAPLRAAAARGRRGAGLAAGPGEDRAR